MVEPYLCLEVVDACLYVVILEAEEARLRARLLLWLVGGGVLGVRARRMRLLGAKSLLRREPRTRSDHRCLDALVEATVRCVRVLSLTVLQSLQEHSL